MKITVTGFFDGYEMELSAHLEEGVVQKDIDDIVKNMKKFLIEEGASYTIVKKPEV